MRLNHSFFVREDIVQISKDLLGKYLVTQFDGEMTAGKIVETEAYRGSDDKACHAYNYRRTKRTQTLFEEAGTIYVYLCYGIHHLFNIVTAPKENPQAVLIRAIEPTDNLPLMLQRRNFQKLKPQLTAGPGTLTKALGISTQHNQLSVLTPDSSIWVEDREEIITEQQIIASPRVGVGYAEECALWDWRFRIKDSKWTSKAKTNYPIPS